MDTSILFTGEDIENWLYDKIYYSGSNGRYYTFQIALNLINQFSRKPTIIETGCQRLEDDLGAGMSTSIFAEYIDRYGGILYSVDNNSIHLASAQRIIRQNFPKANVNFVLQDAVTFLSQYRGPCHLLYLDSFDYPYYEMLNIFKEQEGINEDGYDKAIKRIKQLSRDEIINLYGHMILPCQKHCLNEFLAIQDRLLPHTVLLIDDNQLAGGGKPRLLKEYLFERKEWICLLDLQQSIWLRVVAAT